MNNKKYSINQYKKALESYKITNSSVWLSVQEIKDYNNVKQDFVNTEYTWAWNNKMFFLKTDNIKDIELITKYTDWVEYKLKSEDRINIKNLEDYLNKTTEILNHDEINYLIDQLNYKLIYRLKLDK